VVTAELVDYHATSNSDLSQSAWPVDTDLVFSPGSTKLSLLNQRPIVRAVIQEGIENLRAALMFTDGFPGLCSTLTLVKDSLFTAAMHHKPGATEMLDRLTRDQEYLLKITPLVRVIKFEMTSLTLFPSRVLVSACFEVRSRNAAAPLLGDHSRCSRLPWMSSTMFASSWQTIHILFQGLQSSTPQMGW